MAMQWSAAIKQLNRLISHAFAGHVDWLAPNAATRRHTLILSSPWATGLFTILVFIDLLFTPAPKLFQDSPSASSKAQKTVRVPDQHCFYLTE
jgi:hypothetical protein